MQENSSTTIQQGNEVEILLLFATNTFEDCESLYFLLQFKKKIEIENEDTEFFFVIPYRGQGLHSSWSTH
jgi:hypothetical protein